MNERFKNRLVGGGLVVGLILLVAAAAVQIYMSPLTVPTLADMQRISPHGKIGTVRVLGISRPGDAGPPWDFRVVQTNLTLTNFVQQVSSVDTNWAFIHDWDGDIRKFGAKPYRSRFTAVPWGHKSTNGAIGTGPFSVLIRTTLPSAYTQAAGMFSLLRAPGTNTQSDIGAAFGLRATPDQWGFVFRSTSGGSSAGTLTDDASALDTTPSALAAYAGQTVNIVVTRSGTNAVVFFNGTDVTSLFTFSNPAGWAKSLALGESFLAMASCNENIWYWPKPILRFAVWGSALNASQAASPDSVGSKIVDFTPESTEEPQDNTTVFNAAREYLETLGGGEIILPPGGYRIDGEVKIGRNITWRGYGAPPYPASFRTGFPPGTTWIAPWFGATNRVFVGDQTQSPEVCVSSRTIATLGGGYVTSRWLRSTLSDFVLFGGFSSSSDGITLDRVAAVGINHIGFWFVPGYAINGYGVNSLQVLNCEGPMGKGFHIRGAADVTLMGNFVDGPKGPALWFAGNLCRIVGNVFELSGNPLAGFPTYAWAGTADASSNTITVAHSLGHRLKTGHPVRFFNASGGTLPSPLATNVDYYAVVQSSAAIKVSTKYVDEVTLGGALNGGDIVDLTDTGSGTWYLSVGPSVGMIVNGDHNTVSSNQGQRNYDGGLIVEGVGNNSFIGNQWLMNGNGENTNAPAVRLVATSNNLFVGNQIDDREISAYSQLGFVADSTSLDNSFIGNSYNIDTPYVFGDPDRQLVIDGKQSMFSWNGTYGNLYVPSRAGFSAWDPADFVDSAAIVYDRSGKRLYVSSGTTSSTADWYYAPTYPLAGPAFWSASGGTLSAVNNGAGQTLLSLIGTSSGSTAYIQVNDGTTAASGPTLALVRNYTNSSTVYGIVPAFAELGEILFAGWVSNSVADSRNAASISSIADSVAWNQTNLHSRIDFNITPPTTTARQSALTLSYPSSPTTNDTTLIIPTFNGTNWVPLAKRVKLGVSGTGPGGVGRAIYVD